MKQFSKPLLIVTLCLSFFFSTAQQNDTLEIQRSEKGKINFARFKPDATRKIQDGANFLKTILDIKPEDALKLIKQSTDKLGITHHRYQ